MSMIAILYEDNHLLVVEKPSGLLSQGDNSGDPDLLSILKEYRRINEAKKGDAFLALLHRLDRPVSGLMVFAKTSKAAARLSEQIRRHSLRRDYLVLCHGMMEETRATLTDYLSRKPIDGRVRTVDAESGLRAELSYELLFYDEKNDQSLILVRLDTGRRHQIRVQLSVRNHPIVGDYRYSMMTPADRKLEAPALHALGLGLEHPVSKEKLYFFSAPATNPSFNSIAKKDMHTYLSLASEKGLLPDLSQAYSKIIKEL